MKYTDQGGISDRIKSKTKIHLIVRKYRKYTLLLTFVLLISVLLKYNNIIKNYIVNLYNKQLNLINKNICNKLIINGIKYSNYSNIQEQINNYCNNSSITMEELRNNILKDYWIKDLYIQKIFPNTLKINIIEYNPFAILTKDNLIYHLIDEYGDIINIPNDEIDNFSYLLIIVGDDVKNEINGIFNLLSIYYNITKKLIKIERIGNRRWNLILKDNIIVKMPEENDDIFDVWNNLDKVINIHGLDINLREIDLRIKDKIYLKYNDATAKEIKNIQK